eukprot:NODE_27637_length_506_cov_1.424802.p2 GENE.NODE_27637_length_506_cov_1.424802~~NODE_27637_length_506_cov_1.424802.p2  ORF type:complete len:88 (-),score=19.05 NODE_27637_length_506_cov_1.424802:242-505(-)
MGDFGGPPTNAFPATGTVNFGGGSYLGGSLPAQELQEFTMGPPAAGTSYMAPGTATMIRGPQSMVQPGTGSVYAGASMPFSSSAAPM